MFKFKKNKETKESPSTPIGNNVDTKYISAYEQWSDRIGNAKVQLTNWRIIAVIMSIVCLMLIISISIVISKQKNYVYVAQVSSSDRLQDLRPVKTSYTPNDAIKGYFIGKFIKNLYSLPLDPVLAFDNLKHAYSSVAGPAATELSKILQKNPNLKLIGKQAKQVEISDFAPVSSSSGNENTFRIVWHVISYNDDGQQVSNKIYQGYFTLGIYKMADNVSALMDNPFGIKIIDFSISLQS